MIVIDYRLTFLEHVHHLLFRSLGSLWQIMTSAYLIEMLAGFNIIPQASERLSDDLAIY
jgi:hypothetical protein